MSEEIMNENGEDQELQQTVHVKEMYSDWFLEYASYVILERAVPGILDGLKPVQRRILHSMKQMDDGRFNKAANVIGHTMQYHPHGDAAIGDALVNIGQKDLMIETQGNWGDIRTGDSAAAPRYIEARLSKFALEVAFYEKTTEWQKSYDGRKNEPVNLPMKFPLLLAHGTEGIAVGLATKIMPHNFVELLEASIKILQKEDISIFPDFPTGGMADFSNYNEGLKGGKIRVRAKIETVDKKTLIIRDIPFATTTTSVMESIVKANDNGKIKIKKVVDNTAKHVEILIELPAATSPDVTIDALYAFTDCEISISPNACIIIDEKPVFMGVNDILLASTKNTVRLLKRELEIKLGELNEKWHFSSLEKIFIEERIYRDIEECETWEAVIEAIDKGLDPFKELLFREVTEDDIVRLTEIKIKRISKFDSFKADEAIKNLEGEIKQVKSNLRNLTQYAIRYFEMLIQKYGKGRERKTEIRNFENIQVRRVAVANQKLYVNRADGFVGTGLRKDEYIGDCSDIDDVIAFKSDGTFIVTRVADKTFAGKDIIHASVWKKGDERMVYNMIYRDGKDGRTYAKRFSVTAITRDKQNDLTKGTKDSKVFYFTANPNSESEVVTVSLNPRCSARQKSFDFDFDSLAIKGRGSQGNIITKYPVRKIAHKEAGQSTLGGLEIWYDETVGRLNNDSRGSFVGSFEGDERILVLYKNGSLELTTFDLSNHYEHEKIETIVKFNPEIVITAVHYDADVQNFYVKRFKVESEVVGRVTQFTAESKGSFAAIISTDDTPKADYKYLFGKQKDRRSGILELKTLVDVKGWKSRGNRLSTYQVIDVKPHKPDGPEIIIAQEDQKDLFE
ncbi:MAG: DNA gyrase/topoisomerase IV subunit A [Calditrichaeota bacterium]|nr:MAG: DNA gyrase/topoisomerase IV subunit A [Calditrichota bacterium]MBL1205280.1 DNA gyrase/topoisomerase IV subunit A [Calditrichota bacterium]NOG45109.1 DNA gyrase/topoisomerase IV subunit A [Calditrichota bacterium]